MTGKDSFYLYKSEVQEDLPIDLILKQKILFF